MCMFDGVLEIYLSFDILLNYVLMELLQGKLLEYFEDLVAATFFYRFGHLVNS